MVLVLVFFMRRYEERLSRLALERDLQDKLLAEMRKLEEFRRDFISNVTHEIKTPVTGILGAVDVLTDGGHGLDESDRQELLKVLKDQSVRLDALVEDILQLARLEKAEVTRTAEFVTCDVGDIVATAVNLMRPLAERSGITSAQDDHLSEEVVTFAERQKFLLALFRRRQVECDLDVQLAGCAIDDKVYFVLAVSDGNNADADLTSA